MTTFLVITFKDILRRAAVIDSCTFREQAERAGFPLSTFSNYVFNGNEPSWLTLLQISSCLHLSPDEILGVKLVRKAYQARVAPAYPVKHMTFQDIFNDYLDTVGVTPKNLSALLDYSSRTTFCYSKGLYQPSWGRLRDMCLKLGVSPKQMFGLEPFKKDPLCKALNALAKIPDKSKVQKQSRNNLFVTGIVSD